MLKIGITTSTEKIRALKKRIRAIGGGTAASKTLSIVLFLIDAAQRDKKPTLTSVVSESFPHLKRGAMRDFLSILENLRIYRDSQWNKTDCIYTFSNRSKIEFFSADQPDKVRGPRRQRLFINEANNVPFETFEQLEIRTDEYIFLDWNPVSEFWFYTELLHKREDIDFITMTYLDNEALEESIIKTIEARKNRPDWWKVFGLGQLGELKGKIYNDWQIIDVIPHEARLERYGVDLGYTNDPTSIVAVYYFNGGYIFDEVIFQTEMDNRQIADILKNRPRALVVADSAEPKSIAEIKSFGINIVPAEKGKDSVRYGIQAVQEQRISITKQSVNIIKEYRNYLWETDRDGKILNEPEHLYSHSMDAIRYAISSLVPIIRQREFLETLPNYSQKERPNPAR